MKSLRILQLYSDHRWTGPAEPVLSLSKELIRRGHRVLFACATKPTTRLENRVRKAGLPVLTDLMLNRYFDLFDNFYDVITLPKVLKEYKIDILHTHLSHDHIIGALGNKLCRKKAYLVRTVHEAVPRHRTSLERFVYRKMTDRVITICESARESLIQDLKEDSAKVKTIHGAVDIKRFNPRIKGGKIREKFGFDEKVPVAGVIAHLHDHGKHEYFLKAIPEVKKAVPNAKFFIVGRGSHRPTLEKLVKELNITDDVIFVGHWDEDFPQVLAALDVKVYLVPGFDGSCRAVLEAMAMEKPVVAAKVGPLPETIKDGLTGFLVDPEDTSSLACAIVRLLKDKELARKMGRRGRRLIEEEFREHIRAVRTEEVYYDLMKETPKLRS